jgi:tripartite-type tricarboxylate transporter receptor subunit TctC
MSVLNRNIDRRAMVGTVLGGAAAMAAGCTLADAYPSAPIRLVVPWPAGGGTDFFARLVSAKMEELIGQPIVVENKPGAASNLGAHFVARAEPNGYVILLGDMTAYSVNPALYEALPFDPENDFSPITLTVRFTTVLLVNPRLVEAGSVAGLVAAATAVPGAFRVAHVGVGSPFHLAAVMFEQAAGVKLNQIPYRGAGPAVQAVLAGDAHFMFVDYATARPHVEAGTLKALAVASPDERPALPGVPPVAATAGLEGFEMSPWQGLVAPAGTPPAVIAKLHHIYARAISDSEVRRRLIESGAEPLQSTPEEFTAHRRKEAARWAAIIKAANIRLG